MADTAPAHRLSKSRYLAGLQCHKQLWWRVHEPDAPELVPDVALRNRFAQGAEVDQRARGYVPGGELIDLPFYEYDNKVAATRDAIRHDPPVLYQPWFLADDTYAGVDILERDARGYGVIEVKATNSLKPEHIPDVAVQVHVLRRSGLPVERAEVMHLNPECRHPDLSNLFVREDVTAVVEGVSVGVPDELAAQHAMLGGPLPDVAIGDHCTKPHPCPFIGRCWPKLPDHHVSSLYRIDRKQVLELEADGYATIYDLPTDLELSAIHARQVKAVRSGAMVVEPSLKDALAQFASPLAFLDFETVSLAIPRWPGCRPWQLVPACAGAKKVVAYHASFERECVRHLKEAVPPLAKELERIEKKLVDLLPTIRNHVYDPDFSGSFSIKKTLPPLVPGLSYDDLTIADGETATVELLRLMFDGDRMKPGEAGELREALLRYCERDSWAMVKMLEKLRTLVADQLELFWP